MIPIWAQYFHKILHPSHLERPKGSAQLKQCLIHPWGTVMALHLQTFLCFVIVAPARGQSGLSHTWSSQTSNCEAAEWGVICISPNHPAFLPNKRLLSGAVVVPSYLCTPRNSSSTCLRSLPGTEGDLRYPRISLQAFVHNKGSNLELSEEWGREPNVLVKACFNIWFHLHSDWLFKQY